MIAKECGYNTIEYNASDTRSKKTLKEFVSESIDNTSLNSFFTVKGSNKKASKKTVLIMDEVDGMSSGDRGGNAQLIQFIKVSKIPIICICNDRQSSKVRTLANYCVDLKFKKPTKLQIRNKLFNIARNEGFNIGVPIIEKMVDGTNGDIRQMLNLLQFWSNDDNKNISFNDVKNRLDNANKDLTMGVWDVVPKFFSRNLTIIDGIQSYFVDYGLMPLFMQENYLNFKPNVSIHSRNRNTLSLCNHIYSLLYLIII